MKYQVKINGELRVLHGLTPKYQDYRNDYSPEFIKGLIRRSEEGDNALFFLDAYCLAEYHNSTKELEKLTSVSDKLKQNFFDNTNSHNRCVLNRTRSSSEIRQETMPVANLGELVDGIRALKRRLKKEGKSIKQFRKEYEERNKVNPLKKNPILPVKRIDTKGYVLAQKPGINNSYEEPSCDDIVITMAKMREMSRKKLSEKDE